MKYNVETTMEATCEICNPEKFEEYLAGESKEYFWDYEDDFEGAVENILHQYYLDDGRYKEINGEYHAVKFLEGWGEIIRSKNDQTYWEIESEEFGKIIIKAGSVMDADHWVREA